jgi:hypothetical protein
MTYVWIAGATPGVKRYVDDNFLPPCNLCGERISICREQDCIDKPVTTTTKITKKKSNDDLPDDTL